jgi:hypothetical protein
MYAVAGQQITIVARLRDTVEGKDLVTVTEDGKIEELIDVENRVAEKLLRALLGTPTDDELAKMRSSQEYADYVAYLADLKKKAGEKPVEAIAEVKPPEEAKVDVVKPEPPAERQGQEKMLQVGYRAGTWMFTGNDPEDVDYGPTFIHRFVFGWDQNRFRTNLMFGFAINGSGPIELGGGNAERGTLRIWELAWDFDFKFIGSARSGSKKTRTFQVNPAGRGTAAGSRSTATPTRASCSIRSTGSPSTSRSATTIRSPCRSAA